MILGYNWFLSNPKGYLMSEKLNGVRGKWDGSRMLHRHGKTDAWVFSNAPDFVLSQFPQGIPLEFEIWHGRGKYRETMKLFQAEETNALWASAKFGVFEAPNHPGTIEERAAYIASLPLSGQVFAVSHSICEGRGHLRRVFQAIFTADGEGVVLRKAKSLYVNGRTTEFLKVKCPW